MNGLGFFRSYAKLFFVSLFGRLLYRKYERGWVIHTYGIYQGKIFICMLLSTRNESLLGGGKRAFVLFEAQLKTYIAGQDSIISTRTLCSDK